MTEHDPQHTGQQPLNPLNRNPRIRQLALDIQWITTGITTVGGVILYGIYGSIAAIPSWYSITVMSLAALWTYTGLTARGNVTGLDPQGYQLEPRGGRRRASMVEVSDPARKAGGSQ